MSQFIKQYGARRTGTNLLRAMLQINCPNCNVLMHILGDKHQKPIDFNQLRDELRSGANALEKIKQVTNLRRAETTDLNERSQNTYIDEASCGLAEAIKNRQVFILISIKHPYAWGHSIMKWFGYQQAKKHAPYQASEYLKSLATACHQFNHNYAAWLNLAEELPDRALVVQHEKLLQDQASVFFDICKVMNLPQPASFTAVSGIVFPTHWDNEPTEVHYLPFNHAYYTNKNYLAALTEPELAVIKNTIDWELMRQFGYDSAI